MKILSLLFNAAHEDKEHANIIEKSENSLQKYKS